ncbi:alanine racemase 1 [Gammaproteobacteria bacterium]
MTRPTLAIIDRAALRNNFARVRAIAPGRKVMGIVKANAYGHGIVRVARLLCDDTGVDALGVACLEEAEGLRIAGVQKPITLLEGVFEADEYRNAARLRLTVVIHHLWQIEALESVASSMPMPISVWLKVDTGMHRLGLTPERVMDAWQRLHTCRGVLPPVGLMTHFACADERNSPTTARQLACFSKTVAGLPGAWCLANSAAILSDPAGHGQWVRPGLMLYGVSPFSGESAASLGLCPVMQFTSRLIAINTVRQGEAVGYGGRGVVTADTLVGMVAAGYADGYPRHAPSGTPILVNGRPASLLGRVSMDMLCVDLTNHPDARIGDPVLLWGKGLPVEEIAAAAGTIPYELLSHIARRVAIEERN